MQILTDSAKHLLVIDFSQVLLLFSCYGILASRAPDVIVLKQPRGVAVGP